MLLSKENFQDLKKRLMEETESIIEWLEKDYNRVMGESGESGYSLSSSLYPQIFDRDDVIRLGGNANGCNKTVLSVIEEILENIQNEQFKRD